MIKIFLLWFILFPLYASENYHHYFAQAGEAFQIDPKLLLRIAQIESGLNPHAVNHNKNGTIDIGLMQINSIHLPKLTKIGITQKELFDPEINIYVGTLLLSSHIRKKGYNFDAIGCYHSSNPIHKQAWLSRLLKVASSVSPTYKEAIDPRTRFAQQELSRRLDEKIAQGVDYKTALRYAKAEVDKLLGY